MHTRHGHLRGVADLRTHFGLNANEVAPHTAYMKITSLELEKLRLGRIRQNALRRIAEIDARYLDVAAEKAKLLAAVAATPVAAQPVQTTRHARGFSPRSASGLSLRY
ncbi:MAG: hypothetical protein WA005_11410 [Candidatus Binataceae bacterium]